MQKDVKLKLKSVVILYANDKHTEKEIGETPPFKIIIIVKYIRVNLTYIRINLTKEVKDLYNENFRQLFKNIEDDTRFIKTSHARRLVVF